VRNFITLFILIAVFGVIYHKEHQKIRNDLSHPPFERQVYYRIGTIDPRFNLSEDEARALVSDAAKIWEQPLGHQFFFYNPNTVFTINFIYDQRQKMTNTRQQAERVLADGQDRHQAASDDFYQQKSALDEEFHRHADELSALNARMSQHQQKVDWLNARGGVTQSEVQVMQAESDLIDRDVAVFNQYSTSLDAKQVNLQHQAQNIQSQVDVYNQQTRTYNQNYTGHSFEAGRYNGDMINIYDFDNKDNLRLILAHELGHALGLKHTNDSQSLMYPTLEKQDMVHFKLTQSDIDLLYGRGLSY
jgi:uncharacterized protein YukE